MKWTPIIITTILLSSCSILFPKRSESNRIHHYVLDFSSDKTHLPQSIRTWPYSVRIKRFTISESYARNEIAYRSLTQEINYYNYDQWAVRPDQQITDIAYRHFYRSHLFQSLSRVAEFRETDLVLRGDIIAIGEYDSDTNRYAHLALTLELIQIRDNTTLWAQTWDSLAIVTDHRPIIFVQRIRTMLESILTQSIQSIDSTMNTKTTTKG